jgi:dihydropyrimidinase
VSALLDLVVRACTVVNEDGRGVNDVGIRGRQVVQVGGQMRGARELDGGGLYALPGGVDPHVHLTCGPESAFAPGEARWADDFTSGSEAALAGGITTVGNMTLGGPGETLADAVNRDAEQARRQAIADVLLHPVLETPSPASQSDAERLVAAGHSSLKIFMCGDGFDRNLAGFIAAMKAAAIAGGIVLFHCEDEAVIRCCTLSVLARGAGHDLRHFPATRPVLSESLAVQRAVALCELTGAPTYIVHLSSARALAICAEARGRGLPLYVETRPLYLHLTAERYADERAPLFVAQPPLREDEDREALWQGLATGTIDTIASDHAPWTENDKRHPQHRLDRLRPGVADLETMLPMLMSEGVHRRGLPLERVVALSSSNAARLFGLYPRKGVIAPGADADIVLWDLDETRTVDGRRMRSRAGYSPYDGTPVRGWPRLTIRGGEVVYADGAIRGAPGSGQVLTRGPTQGLRSG